MVIIGEALTLWRKAVTAPVGTNQHSDNITTLTPRRGTSLAYNRHNVTISPKRLEAAMVSVLAQNLARRHMSKGQQALATAMIYPDGGSGGRGRRGNPTNFGGFSSQLLLNARQLLKLNRPDLVERVAGDA
jgi:hypothetical protein